jgi:hypothetical protein
MKQLDAVIDAIERLQEANKRIEDGGEQLKRHPRYKYIICPMYVTSKYDGDWHYISTSELISLYNVKPNECICANNPGKLYGLRGYKFWYLWPLNSGDYESVINKIKKEELAFPH